MARVSLDKIAAGLPSVEGKQQADAKDRLEQQAALDSARHKAETARITESNRDLRVNRRMRYDYAKAVFCYLIWYSAFAGIIILLSGFKPWGFSLPTAALTALVGSTAAAAIGLVGIVVTGLFRAVPERKKKS